MSIIKELYQDYQSGMVTADILDALRNSDIAEYKKLVDGRRNELEQVGYCPPMDME